MIVLDYYKAMSDDYPKAVDLQKTTAYFHQNIETLTEDRGTDENAEPHTYYEYDEAILPLDVYYANEEQFKNYPN